GRLAYRPTYIEGRPHSSASTRNPIAHVGWRGRRESVAEEQPPPFHTASWQRDCRPQFRTPRPAFGLPWRSRGEGYHYRDLPLTVAGKWPRLPRSSVPRRPRLRRLNPYRRSSSPGRRRLDRLVPWSSPFGPPAPVDTRHVPLWSRPD